MNKLLTIVGLTILLSSKAFAFSFDNCHTWRTKELASELEENYRVIVNSGKCDALPYSEQVMVRKLRLEMLETVRYLHNKIKADREVMFWQKIEITREVNNIYAKHALLMVGPK